MSQFIKQIWEWYLRTRTKVVCDQSLFLFPIAFSGLALFGGFSQLRAESPIIFSNVTPESGIEFEHTDGSDGRHFIIESMSAGLALFDYDNDSDLDIYFLNGAPIDAPDNPARPRNALYRNDGNFQFANVTREAGVGDSGFGLGVACADFNNDGFTDLYLNNYGPNKLYLNNSDGTFADATLTTNTGNGELVGGGASFFDMDADGDLDLYVANYIQFDLDKHQVHIHKGLPSYPSPLAYQPAEDSLFCNLGDGTFVDVSHASGIRKVAGRSMGLVTLDYDGDGDLDVYVANDSQENHLFANDGHGQFSEVGFLSGLAFDHLGRGQASMGVEAADFNRDGLIDLVVTSFSEEFVTNYRNAGGGLFDDATLQVGIARPTFAHVTWGLAAEDFNLDGWPDLFIGAGDLDDNRNQRGGSSTASGYRIPDLLFLNKGGGIFEPLDNFLASEPEIAESTRGVVAGDLDGDGDADVVALNARRRPAILRNDSPLQKSISLFLVGTKSNRDAVGAQLSLHKGDELVATARLKSGRSYQSDIRSSVILPTPLAELNGDCSIEILWPNGTAQRISLEAALPALCAGQPAELMIRER